MAIITILGAGVMGSATAWPLSDNGHQIRLVGTHLDHAIIESCKKSGYHPRLKRQLPKNVKPFFIEELEKALDGRDFIVSGVNSMGVRWIGQQLAPFLKPGEKVIAVTKGLETDNHGNLVILPEVLRSELPKSIREEVSLAAIGGPCIAGELAGRRQSCVYFGCREIETARTLAEAFRTDYYHIRVTDDMVGLENAVALKNAYAAGVGIALGVLERSGGIDNAGAHIHNLGAALFGQACTEIHHMLELSGGSPEFAFGLPGAGDLYVTCQGGRSITLGKLLGEGKTYNEAVEILKGETLESALIIQQMAKALPNLESKGIISKEQISFMRLLIDVIVNNKTVDTLLKEFLAKVFG